MNVGGKGGAGDARGVREAGEVGEDGAGPARQKKAEKERMDMVLSTQLMEVRCVREGWGWVGG